VDLLFFFFPGECSDNILKYSTIALAFINHSMIRLSMVRTANTVLNHKHTSNTFNLILAKRSFVSYFTGI
jgi:hypothetical protein